MGIGGNKSAVIQTAKVSKNKIGEPEKSYVDAVTSLKGWLDLLDGDSKHTTFNAKIQESTHIFLCDYVELQYKVEGKPDEKITPENSRMIIDGEIYEVKMYDDPMGMHEHLEIYLKYTGGR
ncbi:MAG: hypothetical protein OSJ60_01970 [Lachnospiraceae bacterium]|nr:hypothetical protein C819_02231 [Lachnospiraceae bacterium 10-1]MCX4350380.1 hypothetical protein [Lachnospiraceae bacterium]